MKEVNEMKIVVSEEEVKELVKRYVRDQINFLTVIPEELDKKTKINLVIDHNCQFIEAQVVMKEEKP